MTRRMPFAQWRRKACCDAGVSLMELMVGLTIMTLFMGMFTGAVVMMYNATSKAEAVGETALQLSMAFSRLDTSVRYASGINEPGPGTDGNSYVEWRSTYSGEPECTQLRLNNSAEQLQQRTWTVLATGGYQDLANWMPLASELQSVPEGVFSVSRASNDAPQKLRVHLVAASMGRTGLTTSVSDVTFTAFNSSASDFAMVCQELGRP